MMEKKFKVRTRESKVMASVFWDSERVLLAGFFDRGAPKAIQGDMWRSRLQYLKQAETQELTVIHQ
jgi:hypothetical protein